MKAFPVLKQFREEFVEEYPRVMVKQHPGLPYPTLYLVDKHAQDLRVAYKFDGKETMASWLQLLEDNGVGKGLSAPEFIPLSFPPTRYCRAWRAHPAGKGERNYELFKYDAACDRMVPSNHPGKCECIDGTSVDIPYTGTREPFRCDEKCHEAGVAPVETEIPAEWEMKPHEDEDEEWEFEAL
eukprot:TRINITY_DN3212_c1_g1_i3.p1 TRINITY_DN3212_c1_g1~~TRINITY_DN3212_c1_g1_i3.p1  ORF type:complete len:183 (+),score=64.02 TRINITY_DN3212_c1_g1_i3:155-703(+)